MNLSVKLASFLSTLLIVAISCNNAQDQNEQPSLTRICRNAQIPIASVDQAKELIRQVWQDTNHDVCLRKYTQSFFDLEPILDKSKQMVSACSEELFQLVKDYHFRYINPPRETYKFGDYLHSLEKEIVFKKLDAKEVPHPAQVDDSDHIIRIPIALQQFFKAFAMQMSGLCKRTMAENLDLAMSSLTDRDHELVEQLFGQALASSPEEVQAEKAEAAAEAAAEAVAEAAAEAAAEVEAKDSSKGTPSGVSSKKTKLFRKKLAPRRSSLVRASLRINQPLPNAPVPNTFDYDLTFRRLIYMPELEGELEQGDKRRRNEVTLLDLRDQPVLNDFMRACERRFKPIYSKLVIPIVRLAKLGYEYVGAEIANLEQVLVSEKALRLMVVTTACEAFGKFKLRASGAEAIDNLHDVAQLDYNPMTSYRIDNELWIVGAVALDREFELLHGHKSKGSKKLMFKMSRAVGRFMAYFDPHRLGWFRRNKDALSVGVGSFALFLKVASFFNG